MLPSLLEVDVRYTDAWWPTPPSADPPDVSRNAQGPTTFIRRVLNQIGQWKREKEPRRTQDSSSSSSPEEKNNTRRDFKCFPKFDTKTLTKRNRLVKAKSEEQKTVERKRCLVRASSEDQHSTAAISFSSISNSRAESLSPPKNSVLTRTKSEEHTAQTKIKLVRANSDGRRYKISNLLSERQRAVASQDALHHSE